MADTKKLYPRTGDKQTVYLKNVIAGSVITFFKYTVCLSPVLGYNFFVSAIL